MCDYLEDIEACVRSILATSEEVKRALPTMEQTREEMRQGFLPFLDEEEA